MPHTPGPWNNIVKMSGFTAVGADTLIARVFARTFRDVENEKANAHLIAAAPDLLAAAKAKLADCEGCKDAALMEGEVCSNECAALMAAIYKAEGRS